MSEYINCENIYGLFSYNKEDHSCPILHAISINEETIKNILDKYVNPEFFKYADFKIQKIKMFSVATLIFTSPNDIFKNMQLLGESQNIMILKSSMAKKKVLDGKIYGFNMPTKSGGYEQVIMGFWHDSDKESLKFKEYINNIKKEKIFDDGLSENPIEFDVYYDDGLMNA